MPKKKNKSAVELAYYKHFNCVQVNMMDIPQIWKDIEQVLTLPESEQDAKMQELVTKWKRT